MNLKVLFLGVCFMNKYIVFECLYSIVCLYGIVVNTIDFYFRFIASIVSCAFIDG